MSILDSKSSILQTLYDGSLIIDFDPDFLITFASSQTIDPNSKESKYKRRKKTNDRDLFIDDLQFQKLNRSSEPDTTDVGDKDETTHDCSWIKISNRNINFECESPIDLKGTFQNCPGLEEVELGVFEFKTQDIKLAFEVNEALLMIKSKSKFKSKLLLSLNIRSGDNSDSLKLIDLLRNEVAILNLSPGKINNESLRFIKPEIKLIFNTAINKITVSVAYSILLRSSIDNRHPIDVTNKISNLIIVTSTLFPTLRDISMTRENPFDPTTPQLFYKSISENTSLIPQIDRQFDIPELETNLLRFQRKTVNWLIEKEGMKYDWNTNRCVRSPVVDEDLLTLLTMYFNNEAVDYDDIDNKVGIFLDKWCFGWSRINQDNKIYWFNKYTCNLSTRYYAYKFILDYYNTMDKESEHILPGQGLLAEEMGLGKTVEITTLILMNQRPIASVNEPIQIQLQSYGDLKTVIKAKTTLIIAPDSILKQWTEEIVHLAPTLAVTIYNGIDKYPKLENNAGLIAEYLRKFDVVFTTYSTISKELDYALYSSRNKPTRNAAKRSASYYDHEENNMETNEDGNAPNSASIQNNENKESLLENYRAMFQLSLQSQKPKVANEKSHEHQHETDYEKALQDEIYLAIKHNKIADIYNSHEYQSPLMLSQFWRVVLDEVQMVSSRLSRAFQSAALIPRYHAWGVSGTPIKKDFTDLHSILRFLKFQPFVGTLSKNSWGLLTTIDKSNTNRDFVKLWNQISLRHTKSMVHDDIKLPPQSRVLMTIPFTPVEQENYNQMFEECLAAICLDSNGSPVLSDWEPSPTVLTYMRYWLVRLRQVCCNPQIGKLNLNSKKYKSKNYNSRVVTTALQLKTLENVLDDMLIKASDQISNAESAIIQLYIDGAQFQEYILMPEKALQFLNLGLTDTRKILLRLRLMLEKYIKDYSEYRSRFNLKSVYYEEEIENNTDEIDLNENYAASMDSIREVLIKHQDKIRSTRQKIRSCKITMHKFYFLIASCHFQCYDEEYRNKIERLKVRDMALSDALNVLLQDNKNIDELSALISGIPIEKLSSNKFDDLDVYFSTPDMTKENLEIGEHRYLELKYYEYAEESRQDILRLSIQTVNKTIESKITSRVWYNKNSSDFVDSGTLLIPKTSKKFFNALPIIDIDSLKDYVVGMKSNFYLEKLRRLVDQLNSQCLIINNWMDELVRILCMPLISHDSTPDGEEYEGSIEHQDKASCYLNAISQILIDRNEYIVGEENSSKINVLKISQAQNHAEANKVHNSAFLSELEEIRRKAKPTGKGSLQELVLSIKDVEAELKDEEFLDPDSKQVESELFNKLSEKVRTIFANQKLAQILFQKELNLSCNSVFNSRIEYFKQLQQISDSVQPRKFDFDQEELNNEIIIHEQESHLLNYIDVNSSMGKAISKFRYLQTLIKKDSSSQSSIEEDEELMCIICRSTITIGSLTQCGHKYCKECLDLWLGNHRTCPMCKHHINLSTIYNFTHHKPNLKANAMNNNASHKVDDNLYSIYKPIDDVIIEDIQHMSLKNSYSSKVDMIVKQVLYLRNKDPKVQIVIFSQWQDLLYILGTAFKSANISFLGSHGTLTPEVGGGRRRNKYDSVEEFKDPNNEITCFLLNAKAQASGLTLVNATHIFLCEPLVNTSLELQAISRIHRIGQMKHTTVWMFAIENTVEESIVLMSTKKRLQYFESDTTPVGTENSNGKKLTGETSVMISKTKEKNLSKAESMTLMKSGGIDTLVNKGNGEGESVTNSDLWNAFFCARANDGSILGLDELKNV